MEYTSPIIRLWLTAEDYVNFLENIDVYFDADIVQSNEDSMRMRYPVGILGGKIKLFFMHYNSFDDAKSCWIRRMQRLKKIPKTSWKIFLTDRDGITNNLIDRFLQLQFNHKALIMSASRKMSHKNANALWVPPEFCEASSSCIRTMDISSKDQESKDPFWLWIRNHNVFKTIIE